MFHILIVDEEEHLLWALENNLLPERDDIQIYTANSGEVGLEFLRHKAIDVLICDIKMPGKVDGFQLILRAKEVAPDARVVIMTAFGTNRIQNLAERVGITHYIEKPFNISDLRNVVLELLDAKEGFQGVLSDLELTDIIQMLCLSKRTALLHLKHKEHRGKIVFERGEVVHAEFNDTQGIQAVYAMLALKQGDIYMQSDFLNDRRTIQVGWQDLLLEGVRRADEHQATQDNVDMDDDDLVLENDFGPPRLVSEVVEDPAVSFFSAAELEEIEAASMQDSLDKAHNNDNSDHTSAGLPSKSSPRQHSDRTEVLGSSSMSGFQRAIEESLADPPSIELQLHDEDEDYPLPPGAPISKNDVSSPGLFRREITQPTAIAREATLAARMLRHEEPAGLEADSSPTTQGPPAQPGHSGFGNRPRQTTHSEPAIRLPSASQPAVIRQTSQARDLLDDFSREIFGVRATGIFSESNGMALEFINGPRHPSYDGDVLSAFFREVVACAGQIIQGLSAQDRFRELQLSHGQEIVLMRAIDDTPYIHIAVLSKDVRLGIAIVLMRRYGQKLAECFKA